MFTKTDLQNHGGDFLALTTLVGMLTWFCDGMIFDGKVPFFRDLSTYTFPLKFSLAKSLQAGELPLWDRHIAAGFPLLAAFQPGVFYPPNFAYYLLPFFDAIRFTFFLHYLVAATGAYFLCRWWRYPIHLSIIAATLFTFGGTTVSLSNLLNHFQTAVWLPWMVLTWERALQCRCWRTFVILSVVLLCALLAGSPEVYLLSLSLLFVDGVRLKGQDQSLTMTGVVALFIASNLLVAALGMAQLLPTFELISQSRRDQPIPFEEAAAWSLHPTSLAGLVFPDKEVDASLPIGVRLFFALEIPLLLTHYLGVLSLVAIGAWCFLGSRKERLITLALIGGSLVIAFGRNTPVYGFLFDNLPVLRSVRFPEKFFFFTYACLIYASWCGLAALHREKESERKMPLLLITGIVLLELTVYALLRFNPELLQRFAAPQAGDVSGIQSLVTTHAAILFGLERQIAIAVVLLSLLLCHTKKLMRSTLFHVGMVAVAIVDLGLAHKPFQFLLDPELVMKSKIAIPILQAKESRLFYYPPGRNLHPSFVSVLGRPPFAKATALNTENLLPNTGVVYGIDYFQEIDALTRRPYNDFLNFANIASPDMRVKLLRALNVRYVISFRELNVGELTLTQRFPEQYSWLYEVNNPVPRVYIASTGLQETQPAKIVRMLSSKDFDPFRDVVVDEPVAGGRQVNFESTAQILRYENTGVTIKTSANGSGILVLADSYYPGWKVFVDGRESKILRANHFFRAVTLPPGEHDVKFEYTPRSFTIGLLISLIAVSLVVLVSLALSVTNMSALRARDLLART